MAEFTLEATMTEEKLKQIISEFQRPKLLVVNYIVYAFSLLVMLDCIRHGFYWLALGLLAFNIFGRFYYRWHYKNLLFKRFRGIRGLLDRTKYRFNEKGIKTERTYASGETTWAYFNKAVIKKYSIVFMANDIPSNFFFISDFTSECPLEKVVEMAMNAGVKIERK